MLDEDGSAALAVGFIIDSGASNEELIRLQGVMNSTEAKALAAATRIEKATSGMVDTRGAVASLSTFGLAATREGQTLAALRNKAEGVAEGMILSLERQSAAFGKTRDELRSMKAETAALAAEQLDLGEVAERVRAAEADLYRHAAGQSGSRG
jgi:hypothetical protein